MRFWLRGRQKSHLRLDDWLMLPASGLFIGMCICAISGVHRRVWGYPTLDPNEDVEAYNSSQIFEGQLLEAFQFIQILALGCIKLGALFFYRRIFSTGVSNTIFDTTLNLCIAITILWTMAMTVMNAIQCGSHISTLWTISVSDYLEYCIYVFPFLTGFAISNFLLDVLILALPTPKIWSLHATTTRKIGVTGVFGLAAIGLAASAVRMASYIHLTKDGPSPTADGHLEDTETVFWSILECGLCLLAVNLPSLSAMVGHVSSPASRLLASIRSALSLHSNGSDSHRSSRSRSGGAGAAHGYAADSRVRIHETTKGRSSKWHRLREIDSREAGADAPRVSNGTDYNGKGADHRGSMV
ncbi:MAG: hypothetical protein ALECFALPRED_004379 [Alectoria fallacina]|uniref:Rhodopsin domain-containing protein n=1 Tax=Alectoria fallacina TaxID=1903189 RepID=A0A8H3I5Q1_9LECA|nr:MAG: hypothetical protein ALECFALPRED_004379 [Alectoria fallacina]